MTAPGELHTCTGGDPACVPCLRAGGPLPGASVPDLTALPISRIVDGWQLKDGSLHLHVRCDDRTVRTLTLSTDASARRAAG